MSSKVSLNLRHIGFCGVDDSVNPSDLISLSKSFQFIEWGFLFRSDLAGTPRYISNQLLNIIINLNNDNDRIMHFAGHLCGDRCQEVLNGNYEFVHQLISFGFKRIQINATTANNVNMDLSKFGDYTSNLIEGMKSNPNIEWIIQCNVETESICHEIAKNPPINMNILFDASCGLGKSITEFPKSVPNVLCGYAGGIGPQNVLTVLESTILATSDNKFWIDMESSLRDKTTIEGKDSFSLEKCERCCILLKEIYSVI